MPLVSFDTPWKHQKTFRFLIHFWSVARNGLIILAKKLYHRCLTRFWRVWPIHSLWFLAAYWCLFCNHWTNLLCPCLRLWVFFVCRVNGFVCLFSYSWVFCYYFLIPTNKVLEKSYWKCPVPRVNSNDFLQRCTCSKSAIEMLQKGVKYV